METTFIIIIGIAWSIYLFLLFTKRTKLNKNQNELISSISKELNIPKEEVLWLFIEMGNTFMILSQEKGNEELAKDIDNRGHLKEYKHWKEIANILHESIESYRNHNSK